MRHPLSRAEIALLAGFAALLVLALAGPAVHQPGNYHHFADQRTLWQLPMALDVLSNLPFALAGLAGWIALWRQPARALENVQRGMAALFFTGLLLAAAGSAWYHLAPDEAGLAVDRCAMAVAFAGLLGWLAADRVDERAGAWLGLALLLLGPVAARGALHTGNVLPWAVLQFGGMALILVLALRHPRDGTAPIRWGLVLLAYAVAKVLELGDQQVFALTSQWVSGHTLKHVVAALAALPLILALGRQGESRQNAATATAPACRRTGHA
jgi:hypothetical protein